MKPKKEKPSDVAMMMALSTAKKPATDKKQKKKEKGSC
jgi:hypothetical protein